MRTGLLIFFSSILPRMKSVSVPDIKTDLEAGVKSNDKMNIQVDIKFFFFKE